MRLSSGLFALIYKPAGDRQIADKATGVVQEFLYGPYVTFSLYAAIALLVLGITCKIHKLSAVSGMLMLIILAFRMFSGDLLTSNGLLQTKIIIPIFVLTIFCKFMSDYLKDKKEKKSEEDEAESKPTHKRRAVTAGNKSTGKLTRFGDSTEKKYNYEKSNSAASGPAASSAPVVKLNRSF